jgi:PDDEXK-like domain of unknown function (DUF3799)/SAP domain
MKCGFGKIPNELREGKIVTSPSKLGDMLISPKHYYWKNILKKRESTSAMEEGTMIHKYLLEANDFENDYQLPLDKSLYLTTVEQLKGFLEAHGESTKGLKADLIKRCLDIYPTVKIWDHEIEKLESCGKKLITTKEMEMLEGLRSSLYSNKMAARMLHGAQTEVPGWYTDEVTGVIITFKIDIYKPSTGASVIIDLKKVRTCQPKEMDKWLYNSNAYIQLAMYRDAIAQIEGPKPSEPICGILACESTGPYIVQPFAIDFGSIEAGQNQYKKALMKLVECYETGIWEAFDQGISNMAIPRWAFEQIEYNEEQQLGD